MAGRARQQGRGVGDGVCNPGLFALAGTVIVDNLASTSHDNCFGC